MGMGGKEEGIEDGDGRVWGRFLGRAKRRKFVKSVENRMKNNL